MKDIRKTKIVATLGPASDSVEKLKELIVAGANVFRLNFSHANHEVHQVSIDNVRKASEELNMPVGILQDLGGPKIRITELEGDAEVKAGDIVKLYPSKTGEKSSNKVLYVQTVDPVKVLEAGHQVILADGIIALETIKNDALCVECKVLNNGTLRSKIGVNFPDSIVNLPATTEKDLVDLDWGIKNKVDFVAVSFVQTGADLIRVRDILKKANHDAKIVSKIEVKNSLNNLDDIYEHSDIIMVARGDLGVELPFERIPTVQRELIKKANFHGKPVIVATQMLHSMVKSLRPTRAEVSDIAAAVMTGADAVMLSEETSIGSYPVEAVTYLGKVAMEAEKSFDFEEYKVRFKESKSSDVAESIAYAACAAAIKVNASVVIACTETGYSARLLSKYRPQQPLYAVSPNPETIRRMCMYWGITPVLCKPATSHGVELEQSLRIVQEKHDLANGTLAAVTGGLNVHVPGGTSILEIREMNFR